MCLDDLLEHRVIERLSAARAVEARPDARHFADARVPSDLSGGKREEAYGMFGAVSAIQGDATRAAGPKLDDPLFTANHRQGMRELLIQAGLGGGVVL